MKRINSSTASDVLGSALSAHSWQSARKGAGGGRCVVAPSTSAWTRCGVESARVWPTMPPSEMPSTVALGAPAASSTDSASDAKSDALHGRCDEIDASDASDEASDETDADAADDAPTPR
eukprot:4836378-Pleurochrysis_carterae.AAC.2